ncbi:ABC transporter permease [Telluribacter sp.]|jgi:putative ABC transport system permease protein|uniref:ABC transporter permease n=1 Tax=Telluribacter sp. TaxID=1978767 RepID=UPI002E1681AB|nr:ABC transporter permease [Telluribacter sp.]
MINNYLKIGWRNLRRRTYYSVLNCTGLAVGLTFSLLIGSYVWGEFQVNRKLRNAGQQYLVQSRWKQENMGMDITTLAPIGPALKEKYPSQIANYYRFHGVSATLSKGTNHFRESIQIGDSTLLTQYGFKLLAGNPETALTGPNSVVITAAKAMKLFGKTDVLNETVTVETPQAGKKEFMITAIIQELPPNSVSQLLPEDNEVFMGMGALPYFGASMDSWLNPYIVNYVELRPGVSPEAVEKSLAQLVANHASADIRKNLTVYLTPLTDYYLQSNNGLVRKMILTQIIVALFILLMAIVNFVTISISSSSTRLREIGVRKVLGGLRRQLIAQFLSEALILTLLAAVLSLGLFWLFRPLYGEVVGKSIFPLTSLPWHVSWLLPVLILVVGGLAGGYQALYLSAYSSVDSLKGKGKSARDTVLFRRGLVTVQYSIAIFVFIGAVIVSRQVGYFFQTDLGFQKEAVLTVSSLPRNWSADGVSRMQAARDQFARVPGVESASLSFEIPNGNVGNSVPIYAEGQDSTQAVSMMIMTTDEHYARTYQIPLRAGQFFQFEKSGFDPNNLVLNEAAVKALGFRTAEAALGQTIRVRGGSNPLQIKGIVKDFHVGTMHEAISPLAIAHVQVRPIYRFFSFRLNQGTSRQTIAALEQQWKELFPDAPFDYSFMDQTIQKLYQTELQLEKAAYVATFLALFIVVLGVIGQVSLSVVRRTKEVGIRKVLGASVAGVVVLFIKEYIWIMVLANVLAWPLAYWVLSDWLNDYVYHIRMDWQPFVQVGILLGILTVLLISLQVVRSALRNPVESLRTE